MKVVSEKGFTLIEVLLVIIVIGILAAVAFRSMDVALDNSRWDATTQELDRLSWAIAGNPELFANGVRSDFGYVGDVGSLPPNLDALVTNPGGYATWRGPYIQNDFTQNPNDFKTDAWGNLYTYTGGVTIASGGSGGNPISKQYANAAADLTSNTVQGVVTDAQGNAPGTSAPSISIRITYPNGSGGTTTATTNPNGSGKY
ncbi:MAG TPA: prepilin-type N-terminal cleavage/methylation domain-containing protein, partial [candidate division Zixibacteria bacterium]|nr:prepilin-type N-terminal cleavage/methylation domain-containing protein [candidate division Zixibacteria bacterium]